MKNAGNMVVLAEKKARNNFNRKNEQNRVTRMMMNTFI